jgi:hypothetical protein
VTGRSVSPEQADEILVRTAIWALMCSNDKSWERIIAEVAGISVGEYGYYDSESLRRFEQRHGVLDLRYLYNERIACAWINGPKGWCDWDGEIGCSTWNIGKWPTVEAVTDDWTTIAEAFPFLTLTAQLVPEEGEAAAPAVEWSVSDGLVAMNPEPTRILRPVEQFDIEEAAYKIKYDRFRERGVDRERLQQAVNRVRAKFLPAEP